MRNIIPFYSHFLSKCHTTNTERLDFVKMLLLQPGSVLADNTSLQTNLTCQTRHFCLSIFHEMCIYY